MSFADDLAAAMDDLFEMAGEPATYGRGTDTVPVTAIFRSLTADDLVSEHVMADAVICYVRESELYESPFNRQPLLGDTISRELPEGFDNIPRVQTFEVSAPPVRDRAGRWKLTLQANIRIVP
jgi:hypothetical protein